MPPSYSTPRTPPADMPFPPSARLLGWTLEHFDDNTGLLRVRFDGKPDFLNPAGMIQGGIQAAMLDDTLGPALWLTSQGRLYAPTIDMNVSFLHPAAPGPLFGEGRVVKLGRTIAFLEGCLYDKAGTALTRATATARVQQFDASRS